MTTAATDGTMSDVVDSADDDIAELYRVERHRLLRTAALLTGDRGLAEDLVHDAFIGLQRRWGHLTDRAAAAGYLRVSVLNGARSLHRRRSLFHRGLESIEPTAAPEVDVALLLAEEHREVIAAVRALPRRQQDVVVLRYWLDMSEAEIARALGISAGTVKSSASRALRALEGRIQRSTDE